MVVAVKGDCIFTCEYGKRVEEAECFVFDRYNGFEENEELGWGRKFSVSGSTLIRERAQCSSTQDTSSTRTTGLVE